MDDILGFLQTFGPVFLIIWGLTILCSLLRPQRFLNSVLLIAALMVTFLFAAGLMGDTVGPWFLLACLILLLLALLLVPVLLIVNGIQLIRRESLCAAHLLSLGLGVVVGIGEIATFVYFLGLYGHNELADMSLLLLFVAMTVFYFSFLILSFVLYTVFIQIMPHRMNFKYVIIHGCGLAGGSRMTKLLSNRVDKAIAIYHRCRVKPIIIPSGGQGGDETRSEAEAMQEYLLSRGIPLSHILLEDRSTTTRENLICSKQLIDAAPGTQKKTALVSSNYHIYRCLRLAKEVGLKCTGIGAKVAFYYWPSALIREFIAVFLTKRFLIWTLLGYLVFISPLLYALLG